MTERERHAEILGEGACFISNIHFVYLCRSWYDEGNRSAGFHGIFFRSIYFLPAVYNPIAIYSMYMLYHDCYCQRN